MSSNSYTNSEPNQFTSVSQPVVAGISHLRSRKDQQHQRQQQQQHQQQPPPAPPAAGPVASMNCPPNPQQTSAMPLAMQAHGHLAQSRTVPHFTSAELQSTISPDFLDAFSFPQDFPGSGNAEFSSYLDEMLSGSYIA